MSRRAALLLLALLTACGRGSFTVDAVGPKKVDYAPTERLRVMLPPAGNQGDEGGRVVSGRIVQVLQQTHADVQLLPTADLTAALADARQAKADFIVQPSITAWSEGHAPPFTADQLGIRLQLVSVTSGEVVNAVDYSNESSLFTVSDAPPSSLLDATFDDAVRALIGSSQKR
ncbi:MAG: hypothetical protein SF182_29085 [Deltaproteobacteria bacterium]|nr:hypothetical protein [Deltaproteobacteria bacterium]